MYTMYNAGMGPGHARTGNKHDASSKPNTVHTLLGGPEGLSRVYGLLAVFWWGWGIDMGPGNPLPPSNRAIARGFVVVAA